MAQSMFKVTKESVEWGGRNLSLETGKVARQAHGSVVVNYGDTSVLVTVVIGAVKEDIDFLPLTVQFVAKGYATGKIPGGFFKREGKPSERETLISRLIDRSIRPLFPKGFYNEINVVCNLLTYDTINAPEVPALIGTAAAIAISGITLNGSLAGARVGYCPDKKNNYSYVLNPSVEQISSSSLDLFLSGGGDSILMVESEASELSEEQMLEAVKFGHNELQVAIELIKKFADKVGVKPVAFVSDNKNYNITKDNIVNEIKETYQGDFTRAYANVVKKDRVEALESIRNNVLKAFIEKGQEEQLVSCAIKSLERALVRDMIISTRKRIDGRSSTEVRSIEVEVDILPKTHGSALFTRGNTQALVVTALGAAQDEQIVDDLEGDRREHFMLHYNFPSYAVGEVAALRAPGRREIGHGKLAWRAIQHVLPAKSDFPYTIRVVSEITESDGSSSMATVCGTSLALMDTGVPIKSAVAGIAMGLIKEKDEYVIISDILGDEDHLGDMDFKVAGTETGITALQMDMKIYGINFNIIKESLAQAKEGRLHIMAEMNKVISKPNNNVKEHAPKITSCFIDKSKIRDVIGAGGKNIKDICEKSGASIDVKDNGMVTIFATTAKLAGVAKEMIDNIVIEPEMWSVHEVKVVEINESIVRVEFLGSKAGMIHISEIADQRIESIDKHLKEGQIIKAAIIAKERDRFKFSIRRVNPETGVVPEDQRVEVTRSPRDRSNFSGNGAYERRPNNRYGGSGGSRSDSSGSRSYGNRSDGGSRGDGDKRRSSSFAGNKHRDGNARFDDRSTSPRKPKFF